MWYFGGTLHKAETLLSTVVWHPLSVSVLLNIATPACSPYWGWFMEWVVNRCVKELSLMMTQSASCGESLTQSLTAAPILIGCQASSHTSHTTSSYFNAISHIYWPSCDIIKSHSCRDLAHNVSVTWNGRHAVTLSQCHACNGRRDPSPSWLAKAWSLSRSHRRGVITRTAQLLWHCVKHWQPGCGFWDGVTEQACLTTAVSTGL